VRMSSRAVILAALIGISSSGSALPSKPLTAANKQQIATAIRNLLKDPDSARFRWPAVREWGLYCGWVNAKNSYGGYTGFQPFMIIGGVGDGPRSDGKFLVIKAEIGGGDGIVEKMCVDHGFDMSGPPEG
jgi:hypothetical protein